SWGGSKILPQLEKHGKTVLALDSPGHGRDKTRCSPPRTPTFPSTVQHARVIPWGNARRWAWFIPLLCVLLGRSPANAAPLPSGFIETLVAGGLAKPTVMAFAPDGRLFVSEQMGKLRVI